MGSRGGKGVVDGAFGRWKIVTAPGGAAGAHSAHNAAAPRRRPTTPANPRVSAPSVGPTAVARARRKVGASLRGGGGVWRPGGGPQGRPPACQTKSAGWRLCLRPALFRTLRVLPPPPLPLRFPPPPKRQRKSQAFRPTRPRPVHHPEKGGSDREPLRGRLQPSRRAERAFFRRGAATE